MNRVEVALENIPEELKERDQWLLWDASAERKQPFTLKSARLAPASWNDPDDWLGFDETADFAEDREHVGIGYVFAKANDDYARGVYGGLDLDGCFADGAPEDWLPELQPFLERDAYVEFSPSRADPEKESHGAHIPLAGFEPPEWWSDVNLGDHEGVEAYGSKFFTFTGDRARSSGDEVADTGDWVEEWLADAYEAVTGETAPPRQDDGQEDLSDYERAQRDYEAPESDGSGDDVVQALDRLDARAVAEDTIVHTWNDGASTSGDKRAFIPTWAGASCNGTANVVDADKWIDTGGSGRGGPAVMAAIAMGEADPQNRPQDEVNGSLWWDAVEYLRDELSYNLPEADQDEDTGPSLKELAVRHLDQFDTPEEVPDGFLTDLTPDRPTAPEPETGTNGPGPTESVAETDGGETATESGSVAAWNPDDTSHGAEVERRVYSEVLVPLDPPEEAEVEEIGIQTATHRTAEILNEEFHWIRPRSDTRGWRDTLYNYVREEGIYEPHGEAEAAQLAEKYLGEYATNEVVSQLVGKLERMNRVRAKRLDESPERLVVGNGILDLTTGKLSKHTPGEFHRARLDVEWNPDAEVGAIDEFLNEVVDGKDVDRLYRFVAHTLYKDYPGEKAAMLLGEGRNGKSMFLELVEEFLGEFNTAHQPLRDLNEDRWAAAYLNGKLANVVPDMSDQTPDSMQQFKALTGGDTVSGDVKFENPVRFTNHATLMFACNSMPVLHDDTRGNWRRWQLINFPHTFDNADPDAKDAEPKQSLRERLCQRKEFQGLLVRAVEEIQRWAEDPQEPFFPDADGWKVTRAKMRKAAEPVYDFAHACLRPNEDSELPKEEIRECYRRYATEEGLSKFSDEEFGRRLLNLTDFNIESGRLRSDEGPNHRINVYKGVEFTDRAKSLMRDESPSSAAQKTTDDFAPDASTKGDTAKIQRVVETLRRNADDQGTISRGALAEQLTRRYELDLKDAKEEIETALLNGAVMDTGDGLRET
jgi:putative DNA primase/helicase